jgi:hypothetical protein
MTAQQENSTRLASVIAQSYLRPLVHLLEKLNPTADAGRPRGATPSPAENAFSASACLITIIALESLIQRLWYNRRGPEAPPESPLEMLRALIGKPGHLEPLLEALSECFVLRNVLAHNHVWEVSVRWDDDEPTTLDVHDDPRHLSGSHRQNYARVFSASTLRSRTLDLFLVPTFVGLHEVRACLDVLARFLRPS